MAVDGPATNTSTETILHSDLVSLFLGANNTAIMVNDDAPIIEFSTGWDFQIIPDDSRPPPGHTAHSTSRPNSSIFLSFQGTQVYVFGLLPPGSATVSATYSIDGGLPENRQLESSTDTTAFVGNKTMFVSDSLPYGNHNLSIIVTETGQGRNYSLDFFEIIQPKIIPEATEATESTVHSSKKPNVTAIVGGILGALVLLLTITLLYLLRRKLKNNWNSSRGAKAQMLYHGRAPSGGWAKIDGQ